MHIDEYSSALIKLSTKYYDQVARFTLGVPVHPTHPFEVEDTVLIKSVKPKKLGECK